VKTIEFTTGSAKELSIGAPTAKTVGATSAAVLKMHRF